MRGSQIDAKLTLEYLLSPGAEGQYFDRKSANIKPKQLAETIVAMANADGGVIAVGIQDRQLQGVNAQGNTKVNDFLQCAFDQCKPSVRMTPEFLDIVKASGEADRLLLLHIEADKERVHATTADEVYLRVGDESKKLDYEQRRNLEYDRGSRLYEDELIADFRQEDLDLQAVQEYAKAVGFGSEDWLQLLRARRFLRTTGEGERFTVTGVLLFAKLPTSFLPSARIRFIRYEGNQAEVGTAMNVIRQEYIEGPLVKVLNRAKEVVAAQLREFTALNPADGKFLTVPEYPPFAWLEGIVNAVTHRAYNLHGDDIRIMMYDDRLEILSPGRFPHVVNKNNIREVRYSRNPQLARALTELGWVRELNEGVKRIYQEMQSYFLDEPVYDEPNHSVLLVLKNNIIMRRRRRVERIGALISTEWGGLNPYEKRVMEIAFRKEQLTTKELAELLGRSVPYTRKTLAVLEEKGLLEKYASSQNDPYQYYMLKELRT